MLTVKNAKTYNQLSEESVAFSCTLYWKGKKCGTAYNLGRGGCHGYDWKSPALRDAVLAWADEQEVDHPDFEVMDQIVSKMMEDAVTYQSVKDACKTLTLYRLKGDNSFWRTAPLLFTPTVKQALVEKFGDTLAEIANEEFM